MRRIALIFGLFGCLCCFGQTADSAVSSYEYPFKQGDSIWNKFTSARERVKALQIPNAALTAIPTNKLLDICLDFPYLTDIFAYNSQTEGFNALVKEFNGFREIVERKDLINVLLDKLELIPNIYNSIEFNNDIEKGNYSFKYYVLIYLLKQSIKDSNIGKDQKVRIAEILKTNKEMVAKYSDIFGALCVNALDNLKENTKNTDIRAINSLVVGQTVQIYNHDYVVSKRQTPRGRDVWVEVLDDNDLTSSEKTSLMYNVINNYGADFLSEATLAYNCHAYAWHMSEGHLDDKVWIGYGSYGEDDYWDDGSYYEVSESLATKVSYQYDHSAVRVSSNRYVSKWGAWPLVSHSPNNVPVSYGIPYKFYRRTPPILGPTIVCSGATYYLDDIPEGCNVTWGFKNASSLNSLIQQNSPSTNQCTITPGSTNIDHTLVATIWYGGTALCTVEKGIMTPKSLTGTIHQEGTYHHGITYPSFTIDMETIFAVNQTCDITLQSPKFKHMRITTSTNPSADVNLQRINDETITFSVPLKTTDIALHIYGTSNGACNDFDLRVVAMKNPIDPSSPFYINMSGNTIELELNHALMQNLNYSDIGVSNSKQQSWTLDVYEATTGRKVYTKQVEGNGQGFDTSNWNPGIYVIYGIINGRTYSTKITVK